jgi:1,4-dihydroxy-2-naphthoate octaprenyltransferase
MKESIIAETACEEQTGKVLQFPTDYKGTKDDSQHHQEEKSMFRPLSIKGRLLLALYYFGCIIVIIPVLFIIAHFFHFLWIFPVGLVLGVLIGILGGEIEFRMMYVGPRLRRKIRWK